MKTKKWVNPGPQVCFEDQVGGCVWRGCFVNCKAWGLGEVFSAL